MDELKELEGSIEQKKQVLEDGQQKKASNMAEESQDAGEKQNLFKPVLQQKRKGSWKTTQSKYSNSQVKQIP